MADVVSFSVNSLGFSSSLNSYQPIFGPTPCQSSCKKFESECSLVVATAFVSPSAIKPKKQLSQFKVQATITETEQPKWWERNDVSNMIDIHSSQQFSNALIEARDRLIIVDFYGTWCASCRALYPKLCRTAKEHPEILFLKVNFDENKDMCKNLNIRVLPYFHFYKGIDGLLESFSCSLAKFQKIRDAIQLHSTSHSNIYPTTGVRDVNLSSPKDVLARSSN